MTTGRAVLLLALVLVALWAFAFMFMGEPMVPQHPKVGPCCPVASY